jgi:hypothetical protein
MDGFGERPREAQAGRARFAPDQIGVRRVVQARLIAWSSPFRVR